MAISFVGMLASGFIMSYAEISPTIKFQMYQWHKATGIILLLAFFIRAIWAILSTSPKLPESFIGIEKIAAKAGHLALYSFMIALPISGWVMVSSSVYGLPTIIFDANNFNLTKSWGIVWSWPHIQELPIIWGDNALEDIQGNEILQKNSKAAHFFLAIAFTFTITLHIAAVIKHAVLDKKNLLTRMWWTSK